jgi:sugar phosphate permease
MFYAFSLPGFALAVLLFVALPGRAPEHVQASEATHSGAGLSACLRHPKAWLCAATYMFFNATFWGFLSWAPTYLTSQRHATLTKMGLQGAIPYFCGFAGMMIIGQLGTEIFVARRSVLVSASCLLAALFLYLTMTAPDATTCIGWLSVASFFIYGAFGPFWSVAIGLASTEARGAFSGFVNFWGQVGAFTSQIVIGILADQMKSFDGAFLFMMGTVSTAGLIVLFLGRTAVAVPATAS